MLLFDSDYRYLDECGLRYAEDESLRYFVIRNYPLPAGMYVHAGQAVTTVEVLLRIPNNYNTAGCDMFWLHPALARADGKVIPAAATGPNSGPGHGDHSVFEGNVYCRWSRHYNNDPWKPGEDNVVKLLNRIEWALRNPDADKPSS